MKKFLALILSVAMIFALVACGSKEGDTPNTDGDTQQTDTPAAPVDIVIATGGTTGTFTMPLATRSSPPSATS